MTYDQQATYEENQRRSRILNAAHKYVSTRIEAHYCPACGQCNELHSDSNPPGPRCKWRDSNEHGLDTEHCREDEPGHNQFGEAGYGEGFK